MEDDFAGTRGGQPVPGQRRRPRHHAERDRQPAARGDFQHDALRVAQIRQRAPSNCLRLAEAEIHRLTQAEVAETGCIGRHAQIRRLSDHERRLVNLTGEARDRAVQREAQGPVRAAET